KQTLDKSRSKLGTEHGFTFIIMHNLAHAYFQAGQLQEAIALHEQTLEKRKATFGPDHSATLDSMFEVAYAYQQAGKLDQAHRLFRDLLERTRKKDGAKASDTHVVLSALGLNLLKQQRYVEAEPLLRECLAIREKQLPDAW